MNPPVKTSATTRRRRAVLLALLVAVGATAFWFLWRDQQHQSSRAEGLRLVSELRYDEAAPLLARSLEFDSEDPEVLRGLALAYNKIAPEQAGPYFDRWVEAADSPEEALAERLKFRRDRNLSEGAWEDAASLADLRPEDTDLQRLLATLSFEAGRFADCEKACRSILRIEPEADDASRLLAKALRALRRPGDAIGILERVLKANPRDPSAAMLLGVLFLETDRAEQAIPWFRKVIDLDPGRKRSAHYQLALALRRAGRDEEAEGVMAKSRELQDAQVLTSESEFYPGFAGLQVKAAEACLLAGDLAEAERLIRVALRAEPGHPGALLALARYYELSGRPDDAARAKAEASKRTEP